MTDGKPFFRVIAPDSLGGFVPVVVAAVASSVLTVLVLTVTGSLGRPTGPNVPLELAAILSIVFIWGPAFALIPVGILGYAIERPLCRKLMTNRDGGFAWHLSIVLTAAIALWLLLRVVVVLTGPQTDLVDVESLAVFTIIGLCSALSWWFLVVVPGRRT